MSFTRVRDPGLRAACELVQDVVAALLEHLGDPAAVSKREFPRRAGIGQATLWPLLAGRLFPRTDTLLRIAHTAGLTISVR